MAFAMISVPTTASRFAALQIDSDSDSDNSEVGKSKGELDSGKSRSGKGGKAAAKNNDNKKDKRKKKREQQQSEANELRSLAFKKLPQKSSAQIPAISLQGIANELLQPAAGDQAPPPEGWQQWKQRDEQLTSELYVADLEKALILSKLEFEQQKQSVAQASSQEDGTETASPKASGGAGCKKKKKQQGQDKKMSLKDFQAEGSIEQINRKQEKEEPKPVIVPPPEDAFFNKVEDDVTKIVQKEQRQESYANSSSLETATNMEHDPREEQLKYELEKKDQEIQELKKTIVQWEAKHKEVKARNALLLKMLQQGEMKDKAEILLLVEELLNIKEELSSQVESLHAALEQEKSKVKGLQTEQPKQGNRKGKKGSEADL